MPDLEFYFDEEGNPCVRGEDERLATFIQTDLQGSVTVVSDLIALLVKEEEVSEFNGNAHTLSLAAKTVTIEANFDDDAPDRRLPREEFLKHCEAWRDFLTKSDASQT